MKNWIVYQILVLFGVFSISSCQMFRPSFGKICIQIEDSGLNYTQFSSIQDYQLNNSQIDQFDRYFLYAFQTQLKNKKYSSKKEANTLICYTLNKPAIELQLLQNNENPLTNIFEFKAGIGGILEGNQQNFLLVQDSIQLDLLQLNNSTQEPIPDWAKSTNLKTIEYNSKNYLVLLEDEQLRSLAMSLAQKTIEGIENQINFDLEHNLQFNQRFTYPK